MNSRSLPLPAPVWRRLAAAVYDGLLVLAICMAITALMAPLLAYLAVENSRAPLQLLMGIGAWVYFAASWTRGGQTLGMRAWHLQLRRYGDDAAVSLNAASLRFFAMLLICILPFVIGTLAAFSAQTPSPLTALLLLPALTMASASFGSRRAMHDRLVRTEIVQIPPWTKREKPAEYQ